MAAVETGNSSQELVLAPAASVTIIERKIHRWAVTYNSTMYSCPRGFGYDICI